MPSLVDAIVSVLRREIAEQRRAAQGERVWWVVGGLPRRTALDLFQATTANLQGDWHPTADEAPIPVFLIEPRSSGLTVGSGASASMDWDYLVTCRSRFWECLVIVLPEAANDWPRSIKNASTTVWRPTPVAGPRFLQSGSLPHRVAAEVAGYMELDGPDRLIEGVRTAIKAASGLDGDDRDSVPWRVLEAAAGLAQQEQLSAEEKVRAATGLPRASEGTLESAARTLEVLSAFIDEVGYEEAFTELAATQPGHPVEREIRDLRAHVFTRAASSSDFAQAPLEHFRPNGVPAEWWFNLTKETLDAALTELGRTPSGYKLRLRVANALNADSPKLPAIVASRVDLEITGDLPNREFAFLEVERLVGRNNRRLREPGPTSSPAQISEDDVPAHSRPLRYSARDRGANPVTKPVIVLDSFAPGAVVLSPSATKTALPKRRRGSTGYEQEIIFPQPGSHTLLIFTSSDVRSIHDRTNNQQYSVQGNVATLAADIGAHESIAIEGLSATGEVVWETLVALSFDEDDETQIPGSLYEALVQAHEQGRQSETPPRARESTIRGLEGQLLASDESWRPIAISASRDSVPYGIVDWTRPVLGNLAITLDPRPPAAELEPPPDLLALRSQIVADVRARGVPIAQVDFGEQRLRALIEPYVERFRAWFEANPDVACWYDIVTLHEPIQNLEGGRTETEHEPYCVLLNPLHPLRLGWFAEALLMLREGLQTLPVPVAGILTPHACPDIMALSLWHGNTNIGTKLFIAVPSREPHWSILWNTSRLDSVQGSGSALVLERLGVEVQGLTGGFTSGQAQRTLDETERLLPARSTLRVGVVGRGSSGSPAIEGLWDWLSEKFKDDGRRLPGPGSVEVYDFRTGGGPDASRIANLSSETGERVSWYLQAPGASRFADIVLLDQLGVRNAQVAVPPSRAPGTQPARSLLGPAGLFRVRIRHDQNRATIIYESRVGTRIVHSAGLAGAVERLATRMEHEAAGRGSHLRFEPNQGAIGQRLERAAFISVSSSEIDTACFARGVQGQNAYLWDYDVPIPTGLGDPRPGYYLIARPHDQTKQSVAQALQEVAQDPPSIDEVFLEISRRGLPVLKRLANGGNSARGEIGVLLAARILQDAFRAGGQPRLLPNTENTLSFVVPVDPYERILQRIRDRLEPGALRQRADFLVIVVHDGADPRIVVTPVEVKYRDAPMSTEQLQDALQQASSLGRLMKQLWVDEPRSRLWQLGSRAVLAHIVDQAFRLYGDSTIVNISEDIWARRHERAIRGILEGTTRICVRSTGRLLTFDNVDRTELVDVDGDAEADTIRVGQDDAAAILTGRQASPRIDEGVTAFGFEGCNDPRPDARIPGELIRPRREEAAPPRGPESRPRQLTLDTSDPRTPELQSEPEATPSAAPQPENVARASLTSRLPAEVRERVTSVFRDFIGNRHAVEQLQRDLKRALIERPPHLPKNYLLTGPPSTGKTTLARKIADALGLPFVSLDGRGVQSRDRLFELVDAALTDAGQTPERQGNRSGKPAFEYPPSVVFVDEAHLMPRAVQESFLTMLESRDRTVMLDDKVALVPSCTFVFATTRASELDSAFKTRCTEIQLREYTEEEVATMLRASFPLLPEDVLLPIARVGRGVPRIAIDIARDLDTEILVTDHPDRTMIEHLEAVRRSRHIDPNGATPQDIDYLRILVRHGGPVGERSILSAMPGTDPDRVLNEIEPFLEKKGFIRKTQRGREITNAGRQYLANYRV